MKVSIKNSIRLAAMCLFVLIALSVLPNALYAQNLLTDKITWNSLSAVNQADKSTVNYSCSFITTGNSSVDWVQKNGGKISHFPVTSVTGSWLDLNKDGEATYMISNGAISGSLVFVRSSGKLSVHMKLFVDGKQDQDYIFNISSTNKAQ